MKLSPARRAELVLLLVTLVWGLSFPLIKTALRYAPPFVFLALRFGVGFVLVLPLLRGWPPPRTTWAPGLVLAALLGLSYFAQTLGLVYTTSTRSAFITGLSVVMVPLLYPALTRRAPGLGASIGAGLAAAGLYLLTGPSAGGLNRGDAITLLCALGYALYIIVLEIESRRHAYRDLLAVQMTSLGFLFVAPALASGATVRWETALGVLVAATALILVLSLFLQNRFQKNTTAPRAAVIFAAEPVFAALFAFILLGERLGVEQWLGGALILGGILAAESRS